eukprot:UN01180
MSAELPKVVINTGETPSNVTFKFHQETHTVGNALRHILARDPNTEYVAYTIPHPSEPYLNFRLQTYEGNAQDHLLKGLSTFNEVADAILEEFERAVNADNLAKDNTMGDDEPVQVKQDKDQKKKSKK